MKKPERADNVVIIKSIKIRLFHHSDVRYNMDVCEGKWNWQLGTLQQVCICVTSQTYQTGKDNEHSIKTYVVKKIYLKIVIQ